MCNYRSCCCRIFHIRQSYKWMRALLLKYSLFLKIQCKILLYRYRYPFVFKESIKGSFEDFKPCSKNMLNLSVKDPSQEFDSKENITI